MATWQCSGWVALQLRISLIVCPVTANRITKGHPANVSAMEWYVQMHFFLKDWSNVQEDEDREQDSDEEEDCDSL